MNKVILLCFFSILLTACTSTGDDSSSSVKASGAPTDECASLEYLARQQCLSDKMNAG
ncbi:hypothetical protein RI844_04720 [Thalassotalea fonticola]|uniref:Lipoprotein n=1 Tax=Thalassotalea fonticola TaxID=3065649 RepID=A0ABZ0GT19_9GAMM|nr:hypothetical protein RI844_04720 [Colwelliaceae bacterium S1-1]